MIVSRARRWLFIFVVLLAVAPRAASAQQAPYVDPVLRLLARPSGRAAMTVALRARAPVAPTDDVRANVVGVAVSGTPDAPRIGILAQLRSPSALADLRAAGAVVGAVIDDIVTATIPVSALPSLFSDADFAIVQAARMLEAVNDTGMRLINAHQVRQPNGGAWTGFAGQGAIVGIYDSGIDYTHGDFRRPDGSTRILGLWDQTETGVPPAGFSYGLYCPPATLQSGACNQRDTFGHGTHVAGTAAGDGSGGTGAAFQYAGVAPLADLLVVKGGNGGFAENRIIDGMEWLFAEAGRIGSPAVVNLSLGGQFGPHDGTRLFEQAIDRLTGEGRIVVVSAGNDGSNRNTIPDLPPQFLHADGLPSAGPANFTIGVPTYTPNSGACDDFFVVDLWYETGDALTITVVRPNGTSATAAFGQSVTDNSAAGQIAIENAPGGQPFPANGDFEAFIAIGDCDGSGVPISGEWTIRVTPTASASGRPYHMWITVADFGGQDAFGTTGFSNRVVVGSPGNAHRAITVGAFASRRCFPSQTGQTLCSVNSEPIGDIAVFSAAGPTRDGRLKPEITAPGRLVVSSLSAAANVPSNLITPDGAHWVNQGTSMSAPHVTGAVALLLQASPRLTPEAAKDVLARSAIQDAFTRVPRTGEPEGVPNNQWGHGKLDVRGALQVLGALQVVATLTVDAQPIPTGGRASSRQGARTPLLAIGVTAAGSAPARIVSIGFDAIGQDPDARVVVVRDANANRQIDSGEPAVGSASAALSAGHTTRVDVPVDVVLAPGQTVNLIAALEFSGAAPHSSAVELRLLPGAIHAAPAAGTGAVLVEQAGTAVVSAATRTTVLADGEPASVSENPVRSERLIINFRQRPDHAAIYTASGRLVADVLERSTGLRAEWDLTNEQGTRVAPGVYLLVVDSSPGPFTLKLIVLSGTGAGGGAP